MLTEMGEKFQQKKFVVGMALGESQSVDEGLDENFIDLDPSSDEIMMFSQQSQDEPRLKMSSSERSEKTKAILIQLRQLLKRAYTNPQSLLYQGFTKEMEDCMYEYLNNCKNHVLHLLDGTAVPRTQHDLKYFKDAFDSV